MIYELIDKLYELYDKLADKTEEIHIKNCQKIKCLIASLIEKTYLGDYMINMQMYELRHGEEDIAPRVRK